MKLTRKLGLMELEERITPSTTVILNADNPTVTYLEHSGGNDGDVVTLRFDDGGHGGSVTVNVGGTGLNENSQIDLIKFDGLCDASCSFSATVEGDQTNAASNGIIGNSDSATAYGVKLVDFTVPSAGPGSVTIEGNVQTIQGTTVNSLTVQSNDGLGQTTLSKTFPHYLGGNVGTFTLNSIDGGDIQIDGSANKIAVAGVLGSASATTLRVNGTVGALTAASIDHSTIALGSASKIAVKGDFGSVHENTLTVYGELGSLTASTINDGTITVGNTTNPAIAGNVNKISATGTGTSGEFSATLNIIGNLGTLSANTISSPSIGIGGDASTIAAKGDISVGGAVTVSGNLGTLKALDINISTLAVAGSASKIAATGNIGINDLTVHHNLGGLSAANITSSITVDGDCGKIAAKGLFSATALTVGEDLSGLTAATISATNMNITGNSGQIKATGSFGVQNTFHVGQDLSGLSAGSIAATTFTVDGNAGKITDKGMLGPTTTALAFTIGGDLAGLSTADVAADTIAVAGDCGAVKSTGTFSPTSFTVGGDLTSLNAASIAVGAIDISGDSGAIKATGVFVANTELAVGHNLKSLTANGIAAGSITTGDITNHIVGNAGKITSTGVFSVTTLTINGNLDSLIADATTVTALSPTNPITITGTLGTFSMKNATFNQGTIIVGNLLKSFAVAGTGVQVTHYHPVSPNNPPVITTGHFFDGGTLNILADVPDSRIKSVPVA